MAGSLFDIRLGLLLVTGCSTIGASLCYVLSACLGSHIVLHFFPLKLAILRNGVSQHSNNIVYYLLFLRLTPLLPNWFINLASPILNISYFHFAIATLFGLIPANYMYVQIGKSLVQISSNTITKRKNILSFDSMFLLFILALFTLIPAILKKKFIVYKTF